MWSVRPKKSILNSLEMPLFTYGTCMINCIYLLRRNAEIIQVIFSKAIQKLSSQIQRAKQRMHYHQEIHAVSKEGETLLVSSPCSKHQANPDVSWKTQRHDKLRLTQYLIHLRPAHNFYTFFKCGHSASAASQHTEMLQQANKLLYVHSTS